MLAEDPGGDRHVGGGGDAGQDQGNAGLLSLRHGEHERLEVADRGVLLELHGDEVEVLVEVVVDNRERLLGLVEVVVIEPLEQDLGASLGRVQGHGDEGADDLLVEHDHLAAATAGLRSF